jgi:hypothetical protein
MHFRIKQVKKKPPSSIQNSPKYMRGLNCRKDGNECRNLFQNSFLRTTLKVIFKIMTTVYNEVYSLLGYIAMY